MEDLKTPVYFASYYDNNEYTFLSLNLAMCIFELNYNINKYDVEAKEILQEYEAKGSKQKASRNDAVEFLNFLNNYEKN